MRPSTIFIINVQSMADSPAGGLPMTMSVFAAALGASSGYYHVEGHWESDEKPAKGTARLMLRLFDEMPRYFEKGRQPGMQCYTCHQGPAAPARRQEADRAADRR